jgi:hypothetical protein
MAGLRLAQRRGKEGKKKPGSEALVGFCPVGDSSPGGTFNSGLIWPGLTGNCLYLRFLESISWRPALDDPLKGNCPLEVPMLSELAVAMCTGNLKEYVP